MSTPYVGEIRLFAGNFNPQGWMFCAGQTLAISEFSTLFNLIGTTYGGDGQTTFNLPDLRGRIPVHQGGQYVLGQLAGTETVTLTGNQLPLHTHTPQAQSAAGNQQGPGGGFWAQSNVGQFSASPPNSNMRQAAISIAGGSQPHNNIMPFLALNFIISLFGVFPSQN